MAHLKQKRRHAQTIMTETEFLRYSDQLFAHIEDQLDQCGADFDCEHNGNVLTIEADDGTQIIVNRHTPNQELWIAAKSGGYHFALREGQWCSTRDGSGFFAVLNDVLGAAAGQAVEIAAL
nr:iron donor protein CyaY [Eikenella glucosivorans]